MSVFYDVPRDAAERELMVNRWVDWVLRRTDAIGFIADGDVVERAARAAAEMIVPQVQGGVAGCPLDPPAAPYTSAREGILAENELLIQEQLTAAELDVLRAKVRLEELRLANYQARRQ